MTAAFYSSYPIVPKEKTILVYTFLKLVAILLSEPSKSRDYRC